jgi:hypothetical protein
MNIWQLRVLAVVYSIALIPIFFLAILAGWLLIHQTLGGAEVKRFIQDHQAVVAKRLKDPKVHSFSLSQVPGCPATLLIQFDVDDKATYEMLENDLDRHWGLRTPARWRTKLRCQEKLGKNYGFAGQGIGQIAKGMAMFAGNCLASLGLSVGFMVIALYCLRTRPIGVAKSKSNDEW